MKKTLAIFLILALLTVCFSGCQKEAPTEEQEEKPSVETPKETPEETPASSEEKKEPIKIGVMAPITGANAEYGKAMDVGTQMAMEKINAAGGINGRLLVRELVDDKGDPVESTDLARRFVQDEDIVLVIGSFSSPCSMAAAPIYEDAGLVQLSTSASNPDFPKMGLYQFAIIGRQSDESIFYANNIIRDYVKAKSVALVYVNDDWGKSAFDATKAALEKIGIEITAEEPFVPGEKDFNALLTRIKKTNPEAIHLITMYSETSIMINQIKQMGWDVKILVRDMAQQIIELCGENAEGVIGIGSFIVDKNDERIKSWADEFYSRAGFIPNQHGAAPYDAVYVVAQALERCGDNITRDTVQDALELTDYNGIAGKIQFNEDGAVQRQYRVLGIQNGEWVALTGYLSITEQ